MEGIEVVDDKGGERLLLQAWEDELIAFARAVWARAQGASPGAEVVAEISDEELLRTYGLAKQNHCYEGPIDDWPKRAERAATVCGLRAVLARYARPAIQPVPVSERPWERPGWLDAEGYCWVGFPSETEDFYTSRSNWLLTDPTSIDSRKCDDADSAVVLPHWALPLPAADQQEGQSDA